MDEQAFLRRFTRGAQPGRAAHPGTYQVTGYAADFATFAKSVAAAGGQTRGPVPRAQVSAAVAAFIAEQPVGRKVMAASVAQRWPQLATVFETASQPGQAAQWNDVDLALVEAELGVCENGAFLVTADTLPERALPFLAQHVLVLLDRRLLVADMHAGYQKLASRKIGHHLTWVCGPSKTADIEQTLVIGAHGCRSLTVLGHDGV
jgi:L-lactate utilization protein LutC